MTTVSQQVEQAAQRLWDAQQSGVPCEPIRHLLGENASLDQAYAVQQINNERAIAAGRRVVGRKIGLTSLTVQAQLGVDQPDFGCLFADMAVAEGEQIAPSRVLQPKVEAEIALVLGSDLDQEKHTVVDVINAISYLLPAIEVVGSRIANWNIRLNDTVGDNASSSLFVLGSKPVALQEVDMIRAGMVMTLKGDVVSSGTAAACLGNPLHAAIWLADTMSRLNTPLRAGDIVLTGALGPMVPVSAGDVFCANIQGLGSVTASFESGK